MKLAPDGTVLYSSYFGGNSISRVNGVATDSDGNVYVTGWTFSVDFPVTPGLPSIPVDPHDPAYGIFVTKLDSSGQKIIYSTVMAKSGTTSLGTGIAVDGAGSAIVAGNGQQGITSGPPFVLKINAAGNGVVYFTYLPYSVTFGAGPIAADATGNAYLTGYTNDPTFPTTPGTVQTIFAGGSNPEAFAMKLNPSGDTAWTTFLPGHADPNTTPSAAVTVDNASNVWLTGTRDPTSGLNAAYVIELSADASLIQYLAQFPLAEAGQDVAVDPSGLVHVAGPLGLVSTITPTKPLAPRALSIVNAGSGQFSGTVAGGEIISIYGVGLGPLTPVGATPQSGAFPTTLGGVQVLVDGAPIPLLYVSEEQINAEIPLPVSGPLNGIADIQVVNNSTALPDFRVAITTSVFGSFLRAGADLAITNQDGTVNTQTNPAKAGSYVSIWATGFGPIRGAVNGSVATAANNYCPTCQIQFVTFNFSAVETVQYLGPSPGLIDGLMQINVMIPAFPQSDGATQLHVDFGPGSFPTFQGFVWVTE